MSTSKEKQFSELSSSEEFATDLNQIAELLEKEKGSGLEVGRIAHKWIGNKRYHRFLNANVFSEQIRVKTGRELTARQIRSYVNAHKLQEVLQDAGVTCPNLSVTHLSQIADARCESDEERIELARKADGGNASVRQIGSMAIRLHAERIQARRLVDVIPTESKVKVMDALDLLSEQKDRSVECAILDWEWLKSDWGEAGKIPDVYAPDDPVGHLCGCLQILKDKMAEAGMAFLFHSTFGFVDRRIVRTCEQIGLKQVGKIIWQKTSGTFQNTNTMLRVGHEEIHILCRAGHRPKALNGGTNSVTPKWAAPTSAVSGKQLEAVHRHQKPIDLMDLLIRISTVNGLVVDPFAGSGAAGIAAVRRGCPYVGSELVPEIAETANRRIALAHGENDEVVDAINFFLASATDQDRQAITSHLESSNLHCVQNVIKNIAA